MESLESSLLLIQKCALLILEASKTLEFPKISSSAELDEKRRKYKVPSGAGKTFNGSTSLVVAKLKAGGLDRGPWVGPSSQSDRYSALSKTKAASWKGGMLMVEDGDLKYPYINASGKAMVSGIYTAKRYAVSAGETRIVVITNKIIKAIQPDLDKMDKKKN